MINNTFSYITSGVPGTLSVPPFCKCISSQSNIDSCNEYECSCACDMNKNKCDFNCCCDLDCNDDEKNHMFTEDCNDISILAQEENWVEMCYDRSQFEGVNIRNKHLIEYGTIEVSILKSIHQDGAMNSLRMFESYKDD